MHILPPLETVKDIAATLAEDGDALYDLIFDLCHNRLPAFALFATIIKELRKDFNR